MPKMREVHPDKLRRTIKMRGLLIASCVLASLVITSHAASLKRRNEVLVANANCRRAGDPFPNPEDCGSFLQCEASGVAAVKKCPPGLHFNAELRVCDYPRFANCSQGDSSSSDSSSAEGSDGDDSSSEESAEENKKTTRLKKLKPAGKKPNVIPTHA